MSSLSIAGNSRFAIASQDSSSAYWALQTVHRSNEIKPRGTEFLIIVSLFSPAAVGQ